MKSVVLFFSDQLFFLPSCPSQVVRIEDRCRKWHFYYLGFSYGDNGNFSPPMDVTNQIQNGMNHPSVNSNYSSGSGGDSPNSLSPGKNDGVRFALLVDWVFFSTNVIWRLQWHWRKFEFFIEFKPNGDNKWCSSCCRRRITLCLCYLRW